MTAAGSPDRLPRRVLLEADGGSRGNPGPAAYGAVLRDADTGAVIAESAARLGTATNNVAEYRALIAGLELVAAHAPEASLEVRMDSKLVIEQMAGRWKIKHADMRPLALRAQRLTPTGTTWTWVPRDQNAAADALLNAVLDQIRPDGVSVPDVFPERSDAPDPPDSVTSLHDTPARPAETSRDATAGTAEPAAAAPQPAPHDPLVGWRTQEHGEPTILVLLRHGVTVNTEAKLFSGTGGSDPPLTDVGVEQAQRAAEWLARRHDVTQIVASPLRRTRETAAVAADRLGLDVELDDDLLELSFGEWDGLTIGQVRERWPEELARWFDDEEAPPPGGEPVAALGRRIDSALARLLATYPGQTVLVVSHLTPIKMVVRRALDAPPQVLHRMQLAAASLTVVQWWPDGVTALRTFSHVPD